MSRAFLVLASLAALSTTAHAVPETFTFAGRLSDGNGPVTGSVTLDLAIYDMSSGGSPLWSETHTAPATNGLVAVAVGSQVPLEPADFAGGTLWLAVTVNGAPLNPRTQLRSVPYALRAGSSEFADSADTADRLGTLLPGDVQQRVTGTCASGMVMTGVNADGSVICAPDASSGGDITQVTAGGLLGGGGSTGAVTITADPGVIQARVVGSCPGANESIKSISPTGTVTCEADDNAGGDITGVTAGGLLTGGGTSGTVTITADPTDIQARVIGSCPNGSSVTGITQAGGVTCGPRVVSGRITNASVCNSFNTITFSPAFSSTPSVVVTAEGIEGVPSGFPNTYCVVDNVTTAGFNVCCIGNDPDFVSWVAID